MEYVTVDGYEDRLMISRCGKVYSLLSNKILKTTVLKNGYEAISIKPHGRKGKCVVLRIHRLVANAFIPNPENKPQVNHKDGNKLNNVVDNLEWSTGKENMRHAFDTGLAKAKQGNMKENSKLTESDVKFIKKHSKRLGGTMSGVELSEKFGVHVTNINKVIRGATYKNLKY